MRFTILISIIFLRFIVYSQGILNNGARIVFSGGGQIYVAGAANGGYLSQAGGQINPSAAGILTIEGNWTNNSANTGFSSDNGTVVMNGAAQSINGTSSTTFYNLTLSGTAGSTKTQNVNTSVGGVAGTTGVLSIGSDIYNLNSLVLTITNPAITAVTYGTGYVLSETNAAVNPSIMRWNMGAVTGAHVYPFGVAGTQIPFTFNKTTVGATNVDVSTRSTAASNNLPWAGASNVAAVGFMFCPNLAISGNPCAVNSVIDRWWDITTSAAVTANCTFSYRGSENTLNVPYNTGNIGTQFWDGSNWNGNNFTIGSALAVSAGVGAVTASGLSQFCPYVLSSFLVPLPIDLINYSAICKGNSSVQLNWSTSFESNSAYFDIMNSRDGINFTKIASVNAIGNSSAINNYAYTVVNKTGLGNYYRLKMVDKDLTARNSKIEFISDNCDVKEEIPNLYYNQQNGIVITNTSKNATNYTLTIFDAAGKLIRESNLAVSEGYNTFTIDAPIANGIYLVNLVYNNGESISKKIPVFAN